MKYYLFIAFNFVAATLAAQVTITGKAPAYAGKEMLLVTPADYISGQNKHVASALVNANGNFTISADITASGKYKLISNNTEAILYVDPNASYQVQFPAAAAKDANEPVKFVSLLFDTLLTYDINNLVLDFNSRADDFVYYNFNILGSEDFSKRVDTFKIYLSKVYKDVKHQYFADYVAYSVAEIEMLGATRNKQSAHDTYMYMLYFNKHPVLYNHDKYMDFFNKFYGSLMKDFHPTLHNNMIDAVNFHASPHRLEEILKKDQLLSDARIRELVMIKMLKEEYYSREFFSDQILVMLDSIARFSGYREHQAIAQRTILQLTWLQTGYQAPEISAYDSRDSLWILSENRGKHTYIGFWSVENTHSLNDMHMLSQMYKKYKDDIRVVMINVDKDKAAGKEFLKKHPEYNWINLYAAPGDAVVNDYKVTSLPLYYLVGPDGKMLQSPALAPSPNGTFKSIDETFYRISKNLHPQRKSKPGSKD